MRLPLLILFTALSTFISAQTIKISLFNSRDVNSYTLSILQGKYYLVCDGERIAEYKNKSIFFINRISDRVEIRDKNSQIGIFKDVKLESETEDGIFVLRGVNPVTPSREYNDDIFFRVIDSHLKAINNIDLEKYIAAVIEAEGGSKAHLEYYKAQGVLVRTYTIKSIYKHAEDGFNLCDEVHCQAYHGRSSQNPDIYKATKATAGQVLIDQDSILAMTPFHSSCGGQTSSAGIYWQKDLPYLKSVQDPFCSESRNANWEKSISKSEWNAFLKNKGVRDYKDFYNFSSPNRTKYFSEKYGITMRDIRQSFKLKSPYFNVVEKGNNIEIQGHGFGHGIGMCQLGAMEMARLGYTYLDILFFYFQNVSICDYREMDLSRY